MAALKTFSLALEPQSIVCTRLRPAGAILRNVSSSSS